MKNNLLLLILGILLFPSCSDEDEKDELIFIDKSTLETVSYLHISRTRASNDRLLFDKVEAINFKEYNMLWLGGDLTWGNYDNDSTTAYLDSIFDLGNENTLLSLGNHESNPSVNYILNYTNRPNYYVQYKNGITFIILDTQFDNSDITENQLAFFNRVVDTIQNSSHLIVLHHKLIWMYGNSNLEPLIATTSNGPLGSCFYCLNPNRFYSTIYPRLIEVKNKGINVICLAGDIGAKVDQFQFSPTSGITFLASGLSYNDSTNFGLKFTHDLSSQTLTWNYHPIEEL